MNTDYVLACGVVWRRTADPEAGWDLVEGLESRDPELRLLAQTFLVESGEHAIGLLESALAAALLVEALHPFHISRGHRPSRVAHPNKISGTNANRSALT